MFGVIKVFVKLSMNKKIGMNIKYRHIWHEVRNHKESNKIGIILNNKCHINKSLILVSGISPNIKIPRLRLLKNK
jgi:hypothetical protein